jgi:hypothetical protein
MCLFVEIELPGLPRKDAGRLTRELAKRGLLDLAARRLPRSVTWSSFFLGPRDYPCACNLGPEGDEHSATYAFDSERLDAIESTIRYIAGAAGQGGVVFRAAYIRWRWTDLPTPASSSVTLDELVRTIRNGALRRNVRYVVPGKAA